MSRRPRMNHSAAFKAKVVFHAADEDLSVEAPALAEFRGEKTLAKLAEQFDFHANRITQWKSSMVGARTMRGAYGHTVNEIPQCLPSEIMKKYGRFQDPHR